MALRKLFIIVDCDNDAQKDEVQGVFNELSNMRVLTGANILKGYPMYKAREHEFKELFSLVSGKGVKGLMSIQGAQLLTRLIR